jgi:hypothetical protein
LQASELESMSVLSLEEIEQVSGGKPKVDVTVKATTDSKGKVGGEVSITLHF